VTGIKSESLTTFIGISKQIERLPANEQDAAWEKFFASHRHDVQRLALGRSPDGSVGLELRDQNGRVRIALAVQSTGEPILQFLNENGKIVREFAGSGK